MCTQRKVKNIYLFPHFCLKSYPVLETFEWPMLHFYKKSKHAMEIAAFKGHYCFFFSFSFFFRDFSAPSNILCKLVFSNRKLWCFFSQCNSFMTDKILLPLGRYFFKSIVGLLPTIPLDVARFGITVILISTIARDLTRIPQNIPI